MDVMTEPATTWRREIGSFLGRESGPTLVCVGAIHGNEPAGYRAVERVLAALERRDSSFRGEIVAVAGNLAALAGGRRYVAKDLNRQWTPGRLEALRAAEHPERLEAEDREQIELWKVLEQSFARARGPIYFVDLHTSSANGAPFSTTGDTLRNRRFVTQLPIPLILGLEEQIDGALLEYVNGLGHVTVGIEGGQHDLPATIDHLEAGVWLCLLAAGCLSPEDLPEADSYRELLRRATEGPPRITEVRYRHAITPADRFTMKPGYTHFQRVAKHEVLAEDCKGEVRASEAGVVLLPLYQVQGDDGFFLGREVHPFWLKVSAALRKLGIPALSHLLPGVKRHPQRDDTLIVDLRIASFYPLELFHLLGYRKRRQQGNVLLVSRRREEIGAA